VRKTFLQFAAFFAFSVACAGLAAGQATSGDLAGTVRDTTGALLPNASIVVKAESTGVSTIITTNSSGEFHASNLPADKYDLSVTATGFQTFNVHGVLVELNKTSTQDVAMS
jgi:Carboxypeptidase regulatory-like domain